MVKAKASVVGFTSIVLVCNGIHPGGRIALHNLPGLLAVIGREPDELREGSGHVIVITGIRDVTVVWSAYGLDDGIFLAHPCPLITWMISSAISWPCRVR